MIRAFMRASIGMLTGSLIGAIVAVLAGFVYEDLSGNEPDLKGLLFWIMTLTGLVGALFGVWQGQRAITGRARIVAVGGVAGCLVNVVAVCLFAYFLARQQSELFVSKNEAGYRRRGLTYAVPLGTLAGCVIGALLHRRSDFIAQESRAHP